MKRLYLSLLFLLATFTMLHAQVGLPRRDFSVGASGGYTLNTVSFAYPSIKQKMKGSPQFGFATRYVCEKYFNTICAVQVEVNYQNLGWKEDFEERNDVAYTRNLHYINVPFLMQMGWGKERRGLKFLFEAGPQIGFLLSDDEKKEGNPELVAQTISQYTEELNKFDYGITAGAGVEFSTSFGHFLLGARYYYGLADFFDTSKKGKFGRAANGTIAVRLTYLFDLLKTKQ